MNVAILGVEQASQGVAYVIENGYNLFLESQRAETLNVVAYVARVQRGNMDFVLSAT